MPAETQLVRDGKPVNLRWGWWHVDCLRTAVMNEDTRMAVPIHDGRSQPFYMGLLNNPGTYKFRKDHTFIDETDGEVFEIKEGDEYSAYRV